MSNRRSVASTTSDDIRPFGAHIRMRWWKPIVVILVVPLSLLALQLVAYLLAGLVEGRDPFSPELTPLRLLAANLTTGIAAVLAIALTARFAGVPWRRLIRSPRGPLRWRRMAGYLGVSALLVAGGVLVTGIVAPDATGWTGLAVNTTTIGLLVVMALTTPLQAAGEELMFRGAVMPAAASWMRAAKPAIAVGLAVSSIAFAAVHATSDPWLFGYLVLFSIATGLMGVISGGLEAAMAFHVANNLVTTTVNTLAAGGGSLAVDRDAGSAGPELLILAAVNAAALLIVWRTERRRGSAATPRR